MSFGTARNPAYPTKQVGVGWAGCHHGELLQGVFADSRLGIVRALVTLPLSSRGTWASFRPAPNSGSGISVSPPDRTKAGRAAELTAELCVGESGGSVAGRLDITSSVPVGRGMGSSTSDVIAAIRAVGDCYRIRLAPEQVARLAVRAERACDSIMIEDRVVLFAHRNGTVLEVLGDRLPPLAVVGCLSGPGSGIDTLELVPAWYDRDEINTFAVLRTALRQAVLTRDAALLGRVVTESARINQRFLPKPELDFLIALAAQAGAAGVQVAHSGTVAGLLFDARLPDLGHRIRRCREALDREGIAESDTFSPP